MVPFHEVQDREKVARLVENIEKNGWQGAPLVIIPVYEQLITGVHRYAAVRELGWSDDEIPTITIQDVFAEASLDFDAVMEENDFPSFDEDGFVWVLNELPNDIRSYYGIDIH